MSPRPRDINKYSRDATRGPKDHDQSSSPTGRICVVMIYSFQLFFFFSLDLHKVTVNQHASPERRKLRRYPDRASHFNVKQPTSRTKRHRPSEYTRRLMYDDDDDDEDEVQ